ncbi:class A beta-lactamase [Caldimonas brevitalea]|uniref:Beta-lactamase n=1 Tax=Caldimonas brevitalea TaxID=413882 RepID=A0A0G3BG19_9BURK|nr:class A beta-lactamase [Caldimonas brevitalea]AKJ28364.1 beta-lactamase [Caldimonas brevitalea]
MVATAGAVLSGCAGAFRSTPGFEAQCKALEAEVGGRLGVALLSTSTGVSAGYRADERFPMCSTFKWLAAAYLLSRVDAGMERLDRRIGYGSNVLIDHSPVTSQHVAGGMTLAQLCEATITVSDNAAANLILDTFGGPAALTRYLRSLGDNVTRLDRTEPALNHVPPGDERDTTTPAAMTSDLRRLLLGTALSTASRDQLTRWMLATQTSGTRLRANLPPRWQLADKTGTANGTANDVGVFWSPAGEAIALSVYLTECRAPAAQQNAAIAEVARWVVSGAVGRT